VVLSVYYNLDSLKKWWKKKQKFSKIQISQNALIIFLNGCCNLLSIKKYIFGEKIGPIASKLRDFIQSY
jgi:hypothetical protein